VDASQVREDDEEVNTKRLVAFMDILNEKGKRFTVNICLNVGLCHSPRHMSFDLDCDRKVIKLQCIEGFFQKRVTQIYLFSRVFVYCYF